MATVANNLPKYQIPRKDRFNSFGINILGDISRNTIRIKKKLWNSRKMISFGKNCCKSHMYLKVAECKQKLD